MAKLKTGRHTSALKELRKTVKRTIHNRAVKKQIRSLAKQVELAVADKNLEEAKKRLSACVSAWDKAAKAQIIHKNAASRKAARLSSKIAKISGSK
jgi:small subunit ribosomal protein S20